MMGRTKRETVRGKLPKPVIVILTAIVGLLGALLLAPAFVPLNCNPGQSATAQFTVVFGTGFSGFRGHNSKQNLASLPGFFSCSMEVCQIEETNRPSYLDERVDQHYITKNGPAIITGYRAWCGPRPQ